jgi:hypothetical protein
MNLVDQLLKADVKKADELETQIFKSKRLAKLIGVEGTVDITIREIKSRRVNDLVAYQVDKKGNMDFSKSFDAKLMMCTEGIVDPDLKDKDLQKHFGCTSAVELCEKIFGGEVNEISDAISVLCGLNTDSEDEIKN